MLNQRLAHRFALLRVAQSFFKRGAGMAVSQSGDEPTLVVQVGLQVQSAKKHNEGLDAEKVIAILDDMTPRHTYHHLAETIAGLTDDVLHWNLGVLERNVRRA